MSRVQDGVPWTAGTDDQTTEVTSRNAASNDVDLTASDIQIGAVEVKDGASDTRAKVGNKSAQANTDNGLGVVVLGVVDDEAIRVTDGSPAPTSATGEDVTVDGTSGGVELLAANSARKALLIANTGSAPMRVRIGANPTATRGIPVPAGGVLSLTAPHCPTGQVKGIRSTGTSTTASPMEMS